MSYDGRLPPLGDLMPHRAMSLDMSSSTPFGLNFLPMASHLFYDDDRLMHGLPTSPMNLQSKPMSEEGEKTGKSKILPRQVCTHLHFIWRSGFIISIVYTPIFNLFC